jgi:cell division protein FtsQ
VARGPNRRRVDRVPGERRARLAHAARRVLPAAAALAAAVGLVAVAWHGAVGGDLLRLREVRFEGLSRATADELLELSPVRPGDHLLLCDTAAVEAALRRHPWIVSAAVRRTLPPALVVQVSERRAAAVAELGGLYLVDERGEVFKRAVPGDGLDLPVISGIGREAWVERRAEVEPLLAGALSLLARWTERGLDRRAPVSEIHVDPEYGTTVWAGHDGLEVRLGRGDLPEKLERLGRVLSAIDAEGRRAQVLHLDNRRRPDWVAVRLAGRRGETDGRSASGGGGGGNGPRGP